jgi:hypothetical protein
MRKTAPQSVYMDPAEENYIDWKRKIDDGEVYIDWKVYTRICSYA